MTDAIFRNLISNAIKFTHNGGEIRLSAKRAHSFVEVSVSDTGMGISEEDMLKLFRTDKVYKRELNQEDE